MKFSYIKIGNKKRFKTLLLLLIILIGAYVLIQRYNSSEVIAKKYEFESKNKDYKFVLGGDTCGIKLLATGVLVVDVDNYSLGLNIGDIILKIDDTKIDSNKELIDYINLEKNKSKEVTLLVEHEGKNKTVKVKPKLNNETGKYELGLWVKDSSAGVGMTTFYELTNKKFAALGHGITETKENIVLPISSGAIVKSKIVSINKGFPEEPGDIRGTIYKQVYGQIKKNTLNGIYGTLETDDLLRNKKETIDIAYKSEIKQGPAKVYCTLDDSGVHSYDIEIKNIFLDSTNNKSMVIQITDSKLIELTGGIIQGMSGSPIVQNGKLIGAVTHVFLNDPTKGYAVFIENMLSDMESVK